MTTITMTVDTSDPTAVANAVRALKLFGEAAGDAVPASSEASTETAEEKAKATAAAKRKTAAAKKKADEEAAAAKAEEEAEKGPTVEDVRAALKSVAALEGKPKAIEILNDHDAASITELDAEKYQAVLDACAAAEG